jgi:hypothetical protein
MRRTCRTNKVTTPLRKSSVCYYLIASSHRLCVNCYYGGYGEQIDMNSYGIGKENKER